MTARMIEKSSSTAKSPSMTPLVRPPLFRFTVTVAWGVLLELTSTVKVPRSTRTGANRFMLARVVVLTFETRLTQTWLMTPHSRPIIRVIMVGTTSRSRSPPMLFAFTLRRPPRARVTESALPGPSEMERVVSRMLG